MTRLWRLASGIAVFVLALFVSVSFVLRLFLGEPTLPGIVNHVFLPIVTLIVIFFSFTGAYLLLRDGLKSK
jgi:hypothetical protein